MAKGASAAGLLPAQLTTFVGRAAELDTLKTLLVDPQARLITLTGAAGAGKTRVALAAAERNAAAFAGGAVFVALADITDPSLLLVAIANALGVRRSGGEALEDLVTAPLRARACLLLLDNFEQIIDAAATVLRLVHCCRRLTVLVTSREALNVRGEVEFQVEPLTLPLVHVTASSVAEVRESVAGCESGQLFEQRAQVARPGFALDERNAPAVATLCHRLDGLPLAIELAAASMRMLTPQALAERLGSAGTVPGPAPRDQPSRQRTVRSAIRWSYELLTKSEQRLFRRLSVFVGGWTLAGAEALWQQDEEPGSDQCLATLSALVRKNMVRRTDGAADHLPRYAMLETIHEFGRARLAENSREQALARERHARHLLEMIERVEAQIDAEHRPTLTELTAEHANLRAALGWWFGEGRAGARAVRLLAALTPFWQRHGSREEALAWSERALQEGAAVSSALRAKVLRHMSLLVSDVPRRFAVLEESVRLFAEAGELHGQAWSVLILGCTHLDQGDRSAARAWLEQSSELFERFLDAAGSGNSSGREGDTAVTLFPAQEGHGQSYARRAQLALGAGDVDAARRLAVKAVSILQPIGSRIASAAHAVLAQVHVREGDREQALRHRWLAAHLVLANPPGMALRGVRHLIAVEMAFGNADGAASLLGAWRANPHLERGDTAVDRGHWEQTQSAMRSTLGAKRMAQHLAAGAKVPLRAAIARTFGIPEDGSAATEGRSDDSTPPPLTQREAEVLELVADGLTDQEISVRLQIAATTVHTHVRNILRKTGASNRAQAVTVALRASR